MEVYLNINYPNLTFLENLTSSIDFERLFGCWVAN